MAATETASLSSFARFVRGFVRLGRFLVFLATAGWIFPHVCTESMDLTRIQNEHSAGQDENAGR
ncbi:MAG: hypothetical protein IT530_00670 [Burkholderiales bacterium]|nr:hypothetical protein [Burkholderiales bacterium]